LSIGWEQIAMSKEEVLTRMDDDLSALSSQIARIRSRMKTEQLADRVVDAGNLAILEHRCMDLTQRIETARKEQDSAWTSVKHEIMAEWSDLINAVENAVQGLK
jgi:predicted  nucleic acid-binding Zn-ribbon protein